MGQVTHPFGSAQHTNAKLAPLPPLLFTAPAYHGKRPSNSDGNAELTRARRQAAATTISPAQPLRSPAAAAARQPCRPIRPPRHSAVYLCSSYKETEHGLRPMQVGFPLHVLRCASSLTQCCLCHPRRSRKVRCNRIPGADKVLPCLIRPHSSSIDHRYPFPALLPFSVM